MYVEKYTIIPSQLVIIQDKNISTVKELMCNLLIYFTRLINLNYNDK